MARKLIERTDGRRKGYQAHVSRVEDRLDPKVRAALDAMRGKKEADAD